MEESIMKVKKLHGKMALVQLGVSSIIIYLVNKLLILVMYIKKILASALSSKFKYNVGFH